jgi:hypothetical protein
VKFYIDGDGLYHLKISERNAKALLSKLSHPWSMKSLECNDIYLDGEQVPVGDLTLVVTIEDDATHYADRMAGEMHPVTENDLLYKSWDVT